MFRMGGMENNAASLLVDPAPPRPTLALVPMLAGRPSDRLVAAFLAGRSPRTIAAYREDLATFAGFMGAASAEDAARTLLERSHGEANELALAYRTRLVDAGLAAATVNRRLAALRSLVKLGRVLGMVPWSLEVSNLDAAPYRDTTGPAVDGVRKLLAAARAGRHPVRDVCLTRLLFDLALRRAEVCGLELAHVDLEAGRVLVLGKGRRAREPITLPAPTAAALATWIAERGTEPGPLFPNHDHASVCRHLTGASLYKVVRKLGESVGVHVRPHQLRHAAITRVLDRNGGNIRAAARFSRHRDVRVLAVYDDNRTDIAGEMAALVSDGV